MPTSVSSSLTLLTSLQLTVNVAPLTLKAAQDAWDKLDKIGAAQTKTLFSKPKTRAAVAELLATGREPWLVKTSQGHSEIAINKVELRGANQDANRKHDNLEARLNRCFRGQYMPPE